MASSWAKRGGHVQSCSNPRGARGIEPETLQKKGSAFICCARVVMSAWSRSSHVLAVLSCFKHVLYSSPAGAFTEYICFHVWWHSWVVTAACTSTCLSEFSRSRLSEVSMSLWIRLCVITGKIRTVITHTYIHNIYTCCSTSTMCMDPD